MSSEIILIIILIIISLIVLKKSFDWGVTPYAFIVVFGFFGLFFKGFYGLLIGLAGGYIISILLGSFSGIGLFKKKDRKLMAGKFIQNNKNEILDLEKFKKLSNKKIVNIFSDYINEIYEYSNKLEDPAKRHSYDLEIAGLRPNFKKGAENWLSKFKDDKEKLLMKKYIDFLDYVIYENPHLVKNNHNL